MVWKKDSWALHHDCRLHLAFKNRPYQGYAPKDADIIIIGKDPNFPPNLSQIEKNLLYIFLEKPTFFYKYFGSNIIHPFLIEGCFGRNKKYYEDLITIFTPNVDNKFCFIDLFPIPSIGSSGKNKNFKDRITDVHIEKIINLIIKYVDTKTVHIANGLEKWI